MNPEIHRIVTGEGLWLKEAPDRGVRFNMAQGNLDGERESIATEGVAHQEVVRPQDVKTMGLRP